MNRAARRRAGMKGPASRPVEVGWLDHGHEMFAMPLALAFELQRQHPLTGMAELLYAIRADEGPEAVVHICFDCEAIGVVL